MSDENQLLTVEFYIQAAQKHGKDSEPGHEVGDLQDFLRAIWGTLSLEQKVAFAKNPDVQGTLEATLVEYEAELDRLESMKPAEAHEQDSTRRVLEVTSTQMARVAALWREIAGEPVTVEIVGGCFYGRCSELGAYRLERRYNNRPTCEALYSKNLETWMFRLEPASARAESGAQTSAEGTDAVNTSQDKG